MPKGTPGQYFLSKGVAPDALTERLEQLLPLEREVIIARALGETLRQIGGRHGLTAEGVRQVERRALDKLRGGSLRDGVEGERFRQAVEQRLGRPLEQVLRRLPSPQARLVLAYARGEPVFSLASRLGLSLCEALALRDQGVARLLGEERGSRAGRWIELKAMVVAALAQRPLTYGELERLFPMSRRRLTRLMQELVAEGRAEVGDDYPFRFMLPAGGAGYKEGQTSTS
ncbi:RNA polymerase sigma factor RpoH [Meiothermus luteus]|uniref:RNA polymerase sigma factor RpoH n=1 Tax=Meiothermus luteus TaxID=2026184 RepID=A0A399EM77_9DEIN|nr:sigma factor-like helix-turn-helix DNA-binding protein [Meiothermus luteus]RIH83552.1 RNA polymerase sigma factor RpoH [Meiothermus luteus]RMH53351.1 MAG: RNA polymerase subunit sigma-70 [Deinococcota bacterium]